KSDHGMAPFQVDLPLAYGAFYRGWSNYLLAKKLEAQLPADRDSVEMEEFKNSCQEIYLAYESSEFIYLESFLGDVWPADNIICLASLAMHDQLFTPKYQCFLDKKVSQLKTVLDPKTGLIPHSFFYDQVVEGARGSSQSLMLVFLGEIDSDFAKQQYGLYKKHFLDHRLGLLGIREYPHRTQGGGDIDAGPIVWEIGGSASIVSIASAYLNNDKELSASLRNSVETFGVPMTTGSKKKYLFGAIPMADAFIAWVNSFERPN
ncbi:MAG: hypothetical protein K2Q22_01265, partial [Cytophagales bacterium]|nr:hypothetical protein [Cytophagales bacterium]